MKNIKQFAGFLNEALSTESKELIESLDKVASDFWKKRGAKYGKTQTIKDFSVNLESSNFASLPTKIKPDTEFITSHAKIEVGGDSGRSICCVLWITPFLKSGAKGSAIKLTWANISR